MEGTLSDTIFYLSTDLLMKNFLSNIKALTSNIECQKLMQKALIDF